MPRKTYTRTAPLKPLIERFMQFVHPEPNTGCWLWDSALNKKGYGVFKVGGRQGRLLSAHRFSYEMHKGPMAEGLETDHLCRVRCCVNPDHLEAVTNTVNMARAKVHRATCKRGHPFTHEKKIGKWLARQCRVCDRIRANVANHRKRLARLSCSAVDELQDAA